MELILRYYDNALLATVKIIVGLYEWLSLKFQKA